MLPKLLGEYKIVKLAINKLLLILPKLLLKCAKGVSRLKTGKLYLELLGLDTS